MYKYTAHEQIGYFCKDTTVICTVPLHDHASAQAGVIIHDDGRVDLISYATLVCTIDADGWLTCTGTYSATTRKHIGWFMREYTNGRFGYYDAKYAYELNCKINVNTGDIVDL